MNFVRCVIVSLAFWILMWMIWCSTVDASDARHHAVAALNGVYGPLEEWQRVGYRQMLESLDRGEAVWKRAWITTYYPEEGFWEGKMTRWGFGVNSRVAAANELPGFSFVWVPGIGLRQVLDTGADSNDRLARTPPVCKKTGRPVRESADHWLDLWEPQKGILGIESDVRGVLGIPGRMDVRWKHGYAPERTWLN